MAGANLRLPLVGGVAVGEGSEYAPAYQFAIPDHARRFCAVAWNKSPQLTWLNVDFQRSVQSDPARRQSPLCGQERKDAWWPALCRFDRNAPRVIEELSLFDADHYNAGKMLSFDADRGRYYARYYPEAHWVQKGRFESAELESEMTFRSLHWRDAASPYYARCHKPSDGGLYCLAGYRLTPTLGLVYHFRAHADSFQADARRADDYARLLAGSFLTPHR
jgi:hypothetical protein